MPEDKKKKKARDRAWAKENQVLVHLALNHRTNADIISAIEAAPDMYPATRLKELIRLGIEAEVTRSRFDAPEPVGKGRVRIFVDLPADAAAELRARAGEAGVPAGDLIAQLLREE